MLLHADAVAQNRSACVRTGGINRDDADRAFFLTVVVGQLIDQRALTRPRRTGESKYPRLSAVGKKCLEQFGPARRTVFDRADGPGKGARNINSGDATILPFRVITAPVGRASLHE
jgi:hypothetical protein